MLSKMVCNNNQGFVRLQGKGLQPGQVLSSMNWAGVLLTKKLLVTNQATPENFILMEKIFQSQIDGSDYSLDENKH